MHCRNQTHTTRKKNVALFACKEICGSSASCPWLPSLCGGITGVALSFLISYKAGQLSPKTSTGKNKNLLECLIVDEAGGVFWNLQLPLLDVLPELPREAC